jgi:MFS family permease
MPATLTRSTTGGGLLNAAVLAWLITSLYYFWQYVMRSAPGVMMPELTEAFDMNAFRVSSLLSLFYYGYALFSLIGGVALDRLGPQKVVPLGALTVGIGALLFASGDPLLAAVGRFLQGAGGVFALLGAMYIVATSFPPSRGGTMVGVTQMFGSGGGSAGQFAIGPLVAAGILWNQLWLMMGAGAIALAGLLLLCFSRRGPNMPAAPAPSGTKGSWFADAMSALGSVFRNPQSILCGLIAGLMFIPTTIFDMVWGVRFLQEGHQVSYEMAVLRSASVPFGWIIGCPLFGMLSDRIGRRKPVIIGGGLLLLGCTVLILYGPTGVFPPFVLGLVAGIASGAAMLTYTVIKEANRPEHRGTASGVVNFINFGLSALLGPIFAGLLRRAADGGERDLADYQLAFQPLIWGILLAIVLAAILRETGPATQAERPAE